MEAEACAGHISPEDLLNPGPQTGRERSTIVRRDLSQICVNAYVHTEIEASHDSLKQPAFLPYRAHDLQIKSLEDQENKNMTAPLLNHFVGEFFERVVSPEQRYYR